MFLRRAILTTLAFLFIVLGQANAQDAGDIRVGVVVQGADGEPETYCVTLSGENATGQSALQATGLGIVVESGSMGATVCQIEETGCAAPDEPCFCQCMGGDTCAYWAYFHLADTGTWQYSVQGASVYALADGDVEGWWWRDSSANSAGLSVISFDDICAAQTEFPRLVIDDLGREVEIVASPQRIASVSLATDEILIDLVGPERILGVTHFASDAAISNVADRLDDIEHTDLVGNPEVLISLDADLVILSTYNNPAALDQLLDADVPIFVLDGFTALEDIRVNVRMLGWITGEEQRAEELIATMDAELSAVQEAVAEYEPVRVLYYEPGGITYGPGSTVDELIALAGGLNVIAESDLGPYPLINSEFIIAADPDVILLGGWFSDRDASVDWISHDPVLGTLRAVRDGRVYPISDAHLTTVSHYIVRGVEEIAAVLYPAAFYED